MKKITTKSALQTKKLGQQLAGNLNGGEVFGLTGDLGSGKTVFVQGLAKGLGIKQVVNSPTFVVMKVYYTENTKTPARNATSASNTSHLPAMLSQSDCRRVATRTGIAMQAGKNTENTLFRPHRADYGGQAKNTKFDNIYANNSVYLNK